MSAAPVRWHHNGSAFYAAASARRGHARYRLIVEGVPGTQTWDWAIWREGAQPSPLLQGIAMTAEIAKRRAELEIMELLTLED
jgi:hypothetical protein